MILAPFAKNLHGRVTESSLEHELLWGNDAFPHRAHEVNDRESPGARANFGNDTFSA